MAPCPDPAEVRPKTVARSLNRVRVDTDPVPVLGGLWGFIFSFEIPAVQFEGGPKIVVTEGGERVVVPRLPLIG